MDKRLCALGLALFVITDTLYNRRERIRCDYARIVLDSYTEEEFSADFRVSRIEFNLIVTTLEPHWKGRINIETGILMFLYDVTSVIKQSELVDGQALISYLLDVVYDYETRSERLLTP